MKRHVTALLIVAALGLSAQPRPASAQAPKNLTNAELKALLSDTITVRFSGYYGRTGTGVFQKDGTARLDQGGGVMVGSWRLEGDKFCTNYTQVGPGCINIQKTGATTYRVIPDNGDPAGSWELVPRR